MPSNFIEITLQHGCSPVNLLRIFIAPFIAPKNTYGGLLLYLGPYQAFVIFFRESSCLQPLTVSAKGAPWCLTGFQKSLWNKKQQQSSEFDTSVVQFFLVNWAIYAFIVTFYQDLSSTAMLAWFFLEGWSTPPYLFVGPLAMMC